MLRYLKLYILFLKQNIKVMLEYRLDFIIGMFSTILEQGVGFGFIWIIFKNIKDINGWSFYEIVFLYSLITICMSLEHIFCDNLWLLGDSYIRNGKFDGILIRPVNPLFHLICDKIQPDGIGKFIIGLYLLIYSFIKLNIVFNISNLSMLLIFIISGSFIFVGITIILSTTAFYFINNAAVMWSIFQFNEFASYPIDIFNKYIKFFITWIVPYAFVSYYPGSYFLNKEGKNLSYITPLIAIIIIFISVKIWNIGLKKYNSAGG